MSTQTKISAISLSDLLRLHGDGEVLTGDGVALVDSVRKRELSWRRYFPSGLIRRLDAGFGRSCTVHPDTGRALYAICRALRPSQVLETGTYWGYSTAYLAAAVRDNGCGRVHTFDIYPKAGRHIPKALLPYIELHRGRSSIDQLPELLDSWKPTLFFQDSVHDYDGVKAELDIVDSHLPPGSIVLFHDFVAEGVERAARTLCDRYALYVLETSDPQQLGVAVKKSASDASR